VRVRSNGRGTRRAAREIATQFETTIQGRYDRREGLVALEVQLARYQDYPAWRAERGQYTVSSLEIEDANGKSSRSGVELDAND
jgi:hypothetical protein